MINELAKQVYENAKSKGFYDNGAAENIGERLALIHSEVSEALEADRNNKHFTKLKLSLNNILKLPDVTFQVQFKTDIKDTFEDELADIVIRVMDFAAFKNIDLEGHIKAKMRYNSTRPHKHGKSY